MVLVKLTNFKYMERIKLTGCTIGLIILLGLILLFILNQPELAFALFFFSIVLIVEKNGLKSGVQPPKK